MNTDIAVQVDGEPWMQPAGQVVVCRSALQVGLPDLYLAISCEYKYAN